MKELSRALVRSTTGLQTFAYTWRDIALYALGVGAKQEDMEYLFEDGLKVIPTYGAIPYWGTFGITPHRDIPSPVNCTLGLGQQGKLHMAHKLILHKPIDPMGAVLTFEDVVTEIFDRGGKGTVMRTELTARDDRGEKVFTNIGDTLFSAYSAPDSPLFPKTTVEFPPHEADCTVRDQLSPTQHILYRLSGDTNRLHIDEREAHKQGFDRPIMQGLCSFGYACRMAISALFPHQPERVRSIEAQFRNPLFPGAEVELRLWKLEAGRACFRLVNLENGQIILENGIFIWEHHRNAPVRNALI